MRAHAPTWSGYHRQTTAKDLPVAALVLAAADALQAMTQPRAHRAAFSLDDAGAQLAADVRRGRLDPEAVRAVVQSAGGTPEPVAAPRAGGLTARQLEVLRLVAGGHSNRQIAQQLVISPRTAERHAQDVYARIGVASRAGAAMYAMQHDLLRHAQTPGAKDG